MTAGFQGAGQRGNFVVCIYTSRSERVTESIANDKNCCGSNGALASIQH
jgi:hypothetical protein